MNKVVVNLFPCVKLGDCFCGRRTDDVGRPYVRCETVGPRNSKVGGAFVLCEICINQSVGKRFLFSKIFLPSENLKAKKRYVSASACETKQCSADIKMS